MDRQLGYLGGQLDKWVVRSVLALAHRGRTRLRDLDARKDYYEEMAARYAALDPALFYAAPPTPRIDWRVIRRLKEGQVLDGKWASGYEAILPDAQEEMVQWKANQTVRARFWQHERPAPTIICVHGF